MHDCRTQQSLSGLQPITLRVPKKCASHYSSASTRGRDAQGLPRGVEFRGLGVQGLEAYTLFYTWTMHMPGTEAPTVLWTRATRLPQIAKTDQLVIPSFRMQRPCGYNSKILKDSGCNCRDIRQQHVSLNPKPLRFLGLKADYRVQNVQDAGFQGALCS